jgi:hypothetical protein
MGLKNSKDNDKKKNNSALMQKYQTRITIARNGHNLFQSGDYLNAIKKYNEYLNILAELNDRDIFNLTPELFAGKSQVTELLLISHVYWDMAKIYEKSDKLQDSFYKCIDQFVIFTVNQPYQVLNAEMLRKYLKMNKNSKYHDALKRAHQKIYIESKKCYIATFCFGDNHEVTNDLRLFKNEIANYRFGIFFIRTYYKFSEFLIPYVYRWPKIKYLLNATTPFLIMFNSIQKKYFEK